MAIVPYFNCDRKDIDLHSAIRQAVMYDTVTGATSLNVNLIAGASDIYEGTAIALQTVVNVGFDLNTNYLVFVNGSLQNATQYTATGAQQLTFAAFLGGETIKVVNLT